MTGVTSIGCSARASVPVTANAAVPNAASTAHRSCAAHPVLFVVAITLPFPFALRFVPRCRYLLLLFRGGYCLQTQSPDKRGERNDIHESSVMNRRARY
jgi:hypothetical protein